PTMIGSDPDPGPTDSYDGALDELRLYDRALDASEIATLIACGDSP
ncbi:MAG: LamG domain-containing protein, partial [Deltaproteobacteria bacterium]|nr:LamG domain-containing protein [Deltaproteobacteria bacterium]